MKINKNGNVGQRRQGDVLMIKTNKAIPATLVKTKTCTAALGEVTGHHHTVMEGAVGFGETEVSMAEMIQVQEDLAKLVHQEHDAIPLEKGNHEVIRPFEYTPEKIQRVAD
jgi:hypothetical protein